MRSESWNSGPTKIYWTCQALPDGRKDPQKTEIREVRDWRLGAIVHYFKDEFGCPIRTEYRGTESVDDYRYYCLPRTVDRSKLIFPEVAVSLANARRLA